MTPTTPLPHILDPSERHELPPNFTQIRNQDLYRAVARWTGQKPASLPKMERLTLLAAALRSDEATARVAASLTPREAAVVSAYLRYGGAANGEVMRLDLLARGLLEREVRGKPPHTFRHWKANPVRELQDRFVLLKLRDTPYHFSTYGDETERPLPDIAVQARLAAHIAPAGPPPRLVAPLPEAPPDAQARRPGDVAFDLARVLAFIADRKKLKITASGLLARPSLQSLQTAVPLGDPGDVRVPDPHALCFEVLRHAGLLRLTSSEAAADSTAARRLFTSPTVEQMRCWTRAWIRTEGWGDALGLPSLSASSPSNSAARSATSREVLAWALASLAHAGDVWFDLLAFLDALHLLQGAAPTLPYVTLAENVWRPPEGPSRPLELPARDAGAWSYWRRHRGVWYANALVGTLWSVGLVARGRLGSDRPCFALTPWGRAVFGAPGVAPPPEPEASRALVVQPNFDVLAYVDAAGASTLATLAWMTESAAAPAGPVRALRLTQAAVYRALESGLSLEAVLDFLRRHARHDLPANVERAFADWAGVRERLVVRTGVTLLAFPTATERDAYLAGQGGTAVGELFAVPSGDVARPPGAVAVPHLAYRHPNWEVSEDARITLQAPADVVQQARLLRIAEKSGAGWRLTRTSLERARGWGHDEGQVVRWVEDHTTSGVPLLVRCSIEAWLGGQFRVELAEAVVLHVPDDTLLHALLDSERFLRLVSARLHYAVFLVKKEACAEMRLFLEELGFPVGSDLSVRSS